LQQHDHHQSVIHTGPEQQQQQQQQHPPPNVGALALSIAPHVRITRELLGGASAASVAWRHGNQV
jgi:hypothetical protein